MSLPLVQLQASTIPDDSGGPYVIAAYLVFLVIAVLYLSIMAQRLRKVSRQADEIEARLDARDAAQAEAPAAPAPAQPPVGDVARADVRDEVAS